ENEIIDKKNKLAKIDKQILNVSEDEKYTPSIESVSIDKKIYIPGEHVHVNGNIGKRIPNVTIRAFVFDPNGKEVSKSNIDVNKDNSFSATIEPDGLWFEDGIYKLKLEYEFDDKKDEKIIEFNFKANDIWRYATLHKPLKVGPVMRIRKEPRPKSVSRPESRLKEIQNAIEVNAKFAETQKIMLDKDIPSVIIELSVSEESECKIKIPRIVLDSKVGEEDDKFIVLVNGAEIDFHEVISTSHREIALLLEKDYLQIEIIGTITSLTTD
ncbi:MAG: hypothetical protein EB167_08880, partial [Nitrososphaeria archaeon]|nr:hypothetical protein [Nitrososphaeria archaeon]